MAGIGSVPIVEVVTDLKFIYFTIIEKYNNDSHFLGDFQEMPFQRF